MNTVKSKKRKGVLTVEAIIILPIFYVVFMFIISLLSLSYHHLVMQQALTNSGRTLAQYGHLVNMFVSLKELGLDAEVNEKEEKVESEVVSIKDNLVGSNGLRSNIQTLATDFTGDGNNKTGLIDLFQTNFLNNLPEIGQRVDDVKVHFEAVSGNVDSLKKSVSEIGTTIKSVTKDDVFNYLISSLMDPAGGKLLEWMIGTYITDAGASSDIFKNLVYHLYIDAKTADFILVAEYDYVLPFSLIGDYHIQQSVRVHPWIGGNHTEGLKK